MHAYHASLLLSQSLLNGYQWNVFVTFSYQQTPLHVAASNNRDYTVECLVKKGADMNIKDESGVCESVLLLIW